MPTLTSACEAPLLRDLIADHGRGPVQVAMRLGLAQTMDVMNVTQPPSLDWQQVFVDDFLAKYPTESLDDFALFLQMFRRGELSEAGKPQLYAGRVDGVILFECWARYLNLRVQHQEGVHQLRKSNAVSQMTDAVNASPAMAKLAAELKEKARKEHAERVQESALRTDAHRREGFLLTDQATTIQQLNRVYLDYPYEGVRNYLLRRCEELGVEPKAVVDFIPTAE